MSTRIETAAATTRDTREEGGRRDEVRVAIITFSPAGSTRKVGAMLASALEARGCASQLVDITRDPDYFAAPDKTAALERLVDAHDVLCLGGPVYAHHMQFTVIDLVRRLPPVGGRWGRLAVPFVTYGGLTSGRALHDTARALRRGGRRVVLAMKVNAFHSVTREFATKINEGMPGEEARPLVDDLARRIAGLRLDSQSDVTPRLNYQDARNRIKDVLLFHERGVPALAMPRVTFVPEKCSRCGLCVRACPVQRIEMERSAPAPKPGGDACIHCSECVFACPRGAVRHSMRRFEKPILDGGRGRGLLPSHELPASAVYSAALDDGDRRATVSRASRPATEDAA
jgi:ferredoxin